MQSNRKLSNALVGSLAMVAVNIIANLITSDYGRTGPLESLHSDYTKLFLSFLHKQRTVAIQHHQAHRMILKVGGEN